MSKEPKICPYCTLPITSDQETLTTKSDVLYHKECYHNLDIDSQVATIEKKYPTTDAKLARVISQNNVIIDYAQKQEGSLGTIKTIIIIFMVLTIASVILQSCSSALSGY